MGCEMKALGCSWPSFFFLLEQQKSKLEYVFWVIFISLKTADIGLRNLYLHLYVDLSSTFPHRGNGDCTEPGKDHPWTRLSVSVDHSHSASWNGD